MPTSLICPVAGIVVQLRHGRDQQWISLYHSQERRSSGEAVVEGTRIAVHDVIGLLQNGETVDSILVSCFPGLTEAQIYECLAYYEDHRDEINLLVAEQMTQPKA